MSVYYPTGNCGTSGTLPAYSCSPCANREYARMRSIAIYKASSPFVNINSPAEWATKIAAGDARVLWQVSGALSDVSTEQLTGFGDVEFDNGSTSWTAVVRDPNIVENTDFYDDLKLTSEWVLVYKTSSKIWDTGAPFTFTGKPVVTESLKDVLVYEGTFKWVSDTQPVPYAIPYGIFDRCYTVS
jgi:hypothetical protein